ncbi:DNA repair exonuclease [Alkalicella caledoniensis]|uniref:DNA repair exonuclease n=1 Tax=Alkalicella caledoniensis TaxID=2731377 RepID=A0A7G9W8U6_ALKCA|nr:DNA repair exonuclease [Alkalicella caledoniensis]QNO15108.1 DNA repair exonuclease [Alkalicella caledoniensis]
MTIKFLHCADVHLDTPFRGLSQLNETLALKVKDVNKKVLENIVNVAINKSVDFVLIAGDLFDSEQKSLQSQLRSKELFQRLNKHGIKVFAIGGNHDPLNKPFTIQWPDNVHFFPADNPTTMEIEIDAKKVYIHGVSYKEHQELENKGILFPNSREGGINIGLLHCEIGGGTESTYSPCTLNDIREKGYDYWALGHIHKRSVVSAEPYIIYPGSPQGKSIKETDEKGCYVITINEPKWDVEFIETHEVLWVQKEIMIDSLTLDGLLDTLQHTILELEKNINCKGLIVRFYLTGRGELHSLNAMDMDEIVLTLNDQEEFYDKFVWVESIQKNTLPEIDLELLSNQDDFLGTLFKIEQEFLGDKGKLSELVDGLDILNNRCTKRHVGKTDEEQLLKNAKDLVLHQLLKG